MTQKNQSDKSCHELKCVYKKNIGKDASHTDMLLVPCAVNWQRIFRCDCKDASHYCHVLTPDHPACGCFRVTRKRKP